MDRPEDAERGDGVAKPQCTGGGWNGLAFPVAFKGAQKVGGLLYNVEQNALANASKPSTMRMQGQRGIFAGEWAKTADKNALSAAKKWRLIKLTSRNLE